MALHFGYLDTAEESINRIKEGRRNLNSGVLVTFGLFLFMVFLTVVTILTGSFFSVFINGIILILTLSLYIGMVIKRELYSIAILMKEKK